ncbi:MAG: ACP S-malonyltransferase [Victivallales bacterium]|nr:ACP S-malonyltransferase [Victivallales bacterium]
MTRLGLLFAGQGAQHPGMGAQLYESSPAARKIYDQADAILSWPISRLCFEGPQEDLTACAHCQPAIYITSLAAWAARSEAPQADETPAIAGGLSLGELAALTVAGAFDFETGLKAVAERGRLMDELCRRTHGAMAAILGGEPSRVAQVAEAHGIDVANYNCPGQLILSGEAELVKAACEELVPEVMKIVHLEVAGAYHSRLMRPAGEAFRAFLENLPMRKPSLPLVHNVTGELAVPEPAALRERLTEQIYSPVRWEECCRAIMQQCDKLLELGPGQVLTGLARRIDRRFPAETTNL